MHRLTRPVLAFHDCTGSRQHHVNGTILVWFGATKANPLSSLVNIEMRFKRAATVAGSVFVIGGAGLGIMASRFEEIIRPNVTIGGVAVGGLTPEEAKKKLRLWWEETRRTEITLTNSKLKTQPAARSATQWGLVLDDQGTLDKLPREAFWDSVSNNMGLTDPEAIKVDPVLTFDAGKLASLEKLVADQVGTKTKAKVSLVKGAVKVTPENPGYALDVAATQKAIFTAISTGELSQPLVLIGAEPKIPLEDFKKMREVMASFTTHFPARMSDRSKNIEIAASRLTNIVLAPGEIVSFNGSVGQRTVQAGFKEAPLYNNGRHDTGVGGGICQVSTTFYNAALRADLKIVERRNHSMPVAYVPVGHDATVNWGTTDLKIQNNFDYPIGIISQYQRGSLTFMIIGTKIPGKKIEVVSGKRKSWTLPEKRVFDPKVRPGRIAVIEKGTAGHSLLTYRMVYQGGKLVRKDNLGQSYYRGGNRIVAYGPKPKAAPKAMPNPAAPAPVAPTTTPGPTTPVPR